MLFCPMQQRAKVSKIGTPLTQITKNLNIYQNSYNENYQEFQLKELQRH